MKQVFLVWSSTPANFEPPLFVCACETQELAQTIVYWLSRYDSGWTPFSVEEEKVIAS